MAGKKEEPKTSQKPVDDDLEDPVERMLKETGCLEKHYSVQECIAESKDWRQCQTQVSEFRKCMDDFRKKTGRARVAI